MPEAGNKFTWWSVALCLPIFGISAQPAPVVTVPSSADEKEAFEHRVWTKTHGLPDDQVQCLLQSQDGYLWIGTRKGLARFDGLKFTVFNRANSPTLGSEDFLFLSEDSQGGLWIATRAELLHFSNGQLRPFRPEGGLPGDPAYCAVPSRTGLWIASKGGLSRFQANQRDEYSIPAGHLLKSVASLHEDHEGRLWVGEDRALQWFDPVTAAFSTNCMPEDLSKMTVQNLQRDQKGNLWVAFAENLPLPGAEFAMIRYWVRRFSNSQWHTGPGSPLTNEGRPFFLLPDHHGGLWMPAGYGQVVRWRADKLMNFALAGNNKKSYAQCGLADREGNLWFGTETAGLQRWTPRKFTTLTAREGLADDNAWTICETPDGSVWIGTDGGLTQHKNGSLINFGEREGLLRKEVRALAEDRIGRLWVGTMNGLFLRQDGKFSAHPFPGKWFEAKVRVVLPTEQAIWVGTALGLKQLQGEQLTKFDVDNGLAHQEVRALLEDRVGNLWIATAGGGVQTFRDGMFSTITTTNGLSSNFAWALHEDADGAIWIGTEHGLNRWQDGRIATFTTREGLPDNLINFLLEDDFGRLWVAHDRGVYWVRRQHLNDVAEGRTASVRSVSYDESDGLLSLETNGQKSSPAGCKTRDGRLWFSTVKGVAIMDPNAVTHDEVAPLAAIENVRANGNMVFDSASPATEPLGSPHTLSVSNRQTAFDAKRIQLLTSHHLPAGSARVLEFRFTANTFVAPEKARFKYRMRGLNESWIEANTRREAYFTDLHPGRYEFEVIAGNHRGVWQEKGDTFAFNIAPFYYQTWWFTLATGGIAIGVVGGIVAWRVRELRKIHRLEQLSAVTAERARIAKDLHDGLGADLTRLTLLADLASGNAGGATDEHLRKLSKSSHDAARELKEVIWVANPANDSVEGLVARLCDNAEEFLHDAQIKCRLEIAPHFPEFPLSIEQRRNLLLVGREALNNIVKHAQATEARIAAHGEGNLLHLTIEDNGRGFEPTTARAEGLGLSSMKRRIDSLNGTFQIESRQGQGTRIAITIKLEAGSNAGARK